MIKLFRIIGVVAAAAADWVIGQFGDAEEDWPNTIRN